MKHTQGEWYVSDIPQEDGCYIYTDNNRFSAIARVYKGNNPHAAEAEANARLMAASKDLLEALEKSHEEISSIIGVLDGRMSEEFVKTDLGMRLKSWFVSNAFLDDKILAAISKAKGE